MFGGTGVNLYLCNVFHGIRFKVNKGWDSAEPHFFCPVVKGKPRKTDYDQPIS